MTEVGDETFIIAAIMAMRHPRIVVYAGAMTALIFMTVRRVRAFRRYPSLCASTSCTCCLHGSVLSGYAARYAFK